MKAEVQEKMSPPKAVHEVSASSESESEDDSESSTSSDESDSSSSGDDNDDSKSQGPAGDDASKPGEPNENDNNDTSRNADSESSSKDDSDSSSSDSESSGSDSDSTSDESDSSESSSSDESEAKVQNNGPETSQIDSKNPSASKAQETKLAVLSPSKTKPPKREIKQDEGEYEAIPVSPESKPSTTQLSTSIIEGIVKDPAEFSVVDAPGPFTLEDMSSKNEYYIFRFPVGMLNPVHLADAKLSIGNREGSAVQVNNRPFEVMAYDYEPGAETPTVFLPDKSGQLNQVDLQIKSQVVIRQPIPQLNTADIVQFNIDDLRARVHQPPEIRERNFFGSTDSRKSTNKKEKLSKEEKKLLKEKKRLSGEEGKHSKKAKKHKEEEELSEEAKRLKKKEKKLAKELAKKRSIGSEDILSPSSSPKKKKIKKET